MFYQALYSDFARNFFTKGLLSTIIKAYSSYTLFKLIGQRPVFVCTIQTQKTLLKNSVLNSFTQSATLDMN